MTEGVGDLIHKYFVSYLITTNITKKDEYINKDSNINITTNGITGYKKLAVTKYNNYIKYSMIWPELIFIFIGDSGQGDIDTSLMMMKNNIHNMYCCFIHNIIKAKRRRKVRKHKEDDFLYDIYSNKTKQKLAELDIFFFDSYAEVFWGSRPVKACG